MRDQKNRTDAIQGKTNNNEKLLHNQYIAANSLMCGLRPSERLDGTLTFFKRQATPQGFVASRSPQESKRSSIV